MLREVWLILTPQQRRWVLAAQVLSLVMAFSTLAGIASIGPFFAVLSDPQAVDHSGLLQWLHAWVNPDSRHDFTVWLGVAFVALVLLANVVNLAGSFVLNRLAWRIGNDMRVTLFAEYLARPYIFHARTNSAKLVNSIIHETTYVTTDILQKGLTLVTNLVTAALIVLAVVVLNPALALVMLAVLAGGYVLIFAILRRRLLHWGRLRARHSREGLQILGETFSAIKEIMIFRAQLFFGSRFRRASSGTLMTSARTRFVEKIPKYLMECVAVGGLVAAALVLGWHEQKTGLWLGQLTFLAFAAYRLLPMLQQIFAAMVKISAARASFESIAPDLRLARTRPHAVATELTWQGCPQREILLREVSFCYDSRQGQALDGVSLCIEAGTATAFTGANGSGKTTLADVIAGLLAPSAGEVEVDGVRLDECNREAWQSRIAYVPQNIVLLDTTLAGNIALGVPDAQIDRNRLEMAIELAQLGALISTLPGGLNYRIGERGAKLSGGQRQRIGIARALYKNAAVLILDEATNALDSMTEDELIQTLKRLRGRYTIILISHQARLARACDVIMELAGGRIVRRDQPNQIPRSNGCRQEADPPPSSVCASTMNSSRDSRSV